MRQLSYEIVPLRQEHIAQAVALHMEAFPGFFLSFLGPLFLGEFYGAFLEDADAIAFVAIGSKGELLGVIVGTSRPGGFFGKLLRRRWWAFGVASTKAMIRRPAIIGRLLQAVRYRGDPPIDRPRAVLSSIAVSPNSQHQGVGRALLAVWVAAASSRGCAGCYLTTDAIGNDAVNAFYQRNGWHHFNTFQTRQGRLMNRYVRDFPSAGFGH